MESPVVVALAGQFFFNNVKTERRRRKEEEEAVITIIILTLNKNILYYRSLTSHLRFSKRKMSFCFCCGCVF